MERGAVSFDYDNLSIILESEDLQIDLSALTDCLFSRRIPSPVRDAISKQFKRAGDRFVDVHEFLVPVD